MFINNNKLYNLILIYIYLLINDSLSNHFILFASCALFSTNIVRT